MFTLSLRARLFLLVAIFAGITLTLSAVSITNLGDLRESMIQGIERWSMSRNLIVHISRDIEAANAEENSMLSAASGEEVTRHIEEQDRLFKSIDERMAPLDKLLPSDLHPILFRLGSQHEEFRRSDAVLRKLLLDQDSQKARSLYTSEASPLAFKVREVLRRGAEKLDGAKSPKAGAAARDLLSTFLATHAELGALFIVSSDAEIEAGSKRVDVLSEQLITQLDELRDLDSEGQKLAQRVGPLLDDYRRLDAQIVRGARVNTLTHAVDIAVRDDALAKSTRDTVSQLVDKLTTELDQAKKAADDLTARGRSIQLFLSIAGIVGGLIFAGFTVLRIDRGVEAVRGVASEVAGSASELQLATQAISQRSNEEATSLEETSTTMEEMTSAVEQNRSGAIKAREIAEQNREAARQGAEVALRAADAMRSLKDAGTRIADISDTVSELAFQTNILALNAAVEAARAGDHGRGFTVVASEVRTLAQRSGAAAREISALIKESLQRIERGVDLVGKSSQEMTRIMEMSQEVTALVVGISVATQEQAAGITQVSQAVLELNQVVQANSAQAEKMAATAEGLDFQSQELVRAVSTISGSAVGLSHRKPARDPGVAAQARPALHDGAGNGHKNGASTETPAGGEPIHTAPRENDFRSF